MQRNSGAILVLDVAGPEAEGLGSTSRKQFGATTGTIGRAADNDWVLPHAAVSGHHATIDYADGVFYITDTSTNGVFVNSRKNRLIKGKPTPIAPGDTIIIEPFRMVATVTAELAPPEPAIAPPPSVAPAPIPPADPFAPGDPFAWSSPAPSSGPGLAPASQADEVDPLKLLGIDSGPSPAPSAPRAQDLLGASPLADHFEPPRSSPPPAAASPHPQVLIPEDYDPAAELRGGAQPPPPPAVSQPPVAPKPEPGRPRPQAEAVDAVPRPVRTVAPVDAGGAGVLGQLLAGAGLPNAPVTPQLATNLGEILRVVVAGVMDVLRARQQIKDEFRMQATRFKAAENNALKFSANVNDALHNLLVKQNAAYLGPVEAFEDAFRDLRNHQMAMLAGMRVAFESMLAEFDPERLQAQFDRTVKKSLLGTKPEIQYWEMYRQRAQDLAKDAEVTFRNLFGDRFVNAYEEQLDRLTEQGPGRKR